MENGNFLSFHIISQSAHQNSSGCPLATSTGVDSIVVHSTPATITPVHRIELVEILHACQLSISPVSHGYLSPDSDDVSHPAAPVQHVSVVLLDFVGVKNQLCYLLVIRWLLSISESGESVIARVSAGNEVKLGTVRARASRERAILGIL